MSYDRVFPHEIQSVLLQAIIDVDDTMPIVIRGVPPPEKKEQWLQFSILDDSPMADPRTYVKHMVELICFSVHANLRQDGSYDAPWRIAEKYRHILHRASYRIKNTCIQSFECKMTYLDNSSTGSYFQNAEVSSPLLNTHCVLLNATFNHFTTEK
jgi:hypothetical protein